MNPIVTLLRRTLAGAALVGLAIGAAPSANAAFITVNVFNDVADSNGDCSLREAIIAANTDTAVDGCAAGSGDDTIIFSPGALNPTITLGGTQLVVSDNLSIEGQNGASSRVTIDAAGQSRLFLVTNDASFNVSNATLLNGRANVGGAIFYDNDASGALTNVTFLSNQATRSGGALYNEGTLAVSGCTFTSNAAFGETPADGGGAVFNGGTLTVDAGAMFTNNTATSGLGNGGAIFNRNARSLMVTANGGAVSFIGNLAARAGGAIESGGDLTLEGVLFANNEAGINGGALHMSASATTSATGGTVNANVADGEGGGFWNSANGTLTVDGTSFTGNAAGGAAADQGGGAIYSDGGLTTVTDASFDQNDASGASGSGGAILTKGDLDVSGSTFTSNTANRAGGGIEITGSAVSVTASTFTGNQTDRNPGNGGAIHAGGSTTLTIDGGSFSQNLAEEGGAVWISGSTTAFLINGVTMTANTAIGDAASQGGGGFYSDGGDAFLTDVTLTGNVANGLEGSGGGIHAAGGNLVIDGASILNNYANRAGGGVETSGGVIAVIQNSDVLGNRAGIAADGSDGDASPGFGGGIHAGGSTNVTVILSDVSSNRAVQGGGLWNSGFGEMNVRETTVSSNRAKMDGGGVYQSGGLNGTGKTVIRRSLIAINQAGGNGGGVGTRKGAVEIFNSSISGNLAVNGGGFASQQSRVSMLNVTLANNSASNRGGGAWNPDAQDDAFVTLSNTIVADNAAPTANEVSGAYISGGFNLVESTTSAALNADATNIIGQDPMLGPPADNGGPTFTHALLAGSPAIDAGQTSLSVDQRGYVRPIFRDDIGAFEFGAVPPGDIIVASETVEAGDVLLGAAAPNPVATRSTLRLTVGQQENVLAVLYDALGRQVATLFDGTVRADAPVSLEIDAASLSAGVYIVRVTGQTFARSQQVTVVR